MSDRDGRRQEGAGPKALAAWAIYDWANSPFAAIIVTFVFPAYFARAVASDEITGTAQWGWAVAMSAFIVAVSSPVLGAVADAGGRRKPWLAVFTIVTAIATMGLWEARPDVATVTLTLFLIVVANVGLELAGVFYNAMLPDLAPASRIGRWSGWAWGLGYAGGLVALVLVLVLFVQAEHPLFGLDPETAEHVRVVGPFVGIWLLIFSLPLLLLTPDRPGRRIRMAGLFDKALLTPLRTLRHLPRQPDLLRFFIARLIYNDGLATLFAFGGIYAAGTFGMGFDEIILFGIALNLTAGIGAVALAPLDDKIGSKTTILAALAGLIVFGTVALVTTDKTLFWIAGVGLGLFVGPAQAASRTLMARLAPPEQRAELFGFYALTGKITAPIGPLLFSGLSLAFRASAPAWPRCS